jgi:hypothetical protein
MKCVQQRKGETWSGLEESPRKMAVVGRGWPGNADVTTPVTMLLNLSCSKFETVRLRFNI